MTDLDKKIDAAISKLTKRNQTTQEAKKKGGASWIIALVTALLSLAGIAVAAWMAHRRARELAKARTELEQQKVKAAEERHNTKQEHRQKERDKLREEVEAKEKVIAQTEEALEVAEEAHAEREKKIVGLRSWEEINEL